MKHPRSVKHARKILIVVLSAVTLATLLVSPGSAATPAAGASALLYNYEFTGTTGTVVNSAPNGPDVPLTLFGSWSPAYDGVHFSGNMTGDESVAYGEPTTGYTLNEPPTAAVGFGARITYFRPTSGKCFGKGQFSPNITQIGRFSSKPFPTQAKIQLSSCQTSSTQVLFECRFAGSLTVSSSDPPVVSTMALQNDNQYNVSCMKTPDHDGTTSIVLAVTWMKTGETTTNTFSQPALGTMQSTAYLSAGNKYALPPPTQNSDQFNGDMTRTVYCAGTTDEVESCLQTYLPG
jgi:hypothetical protein